MHSVSTERNRTPRQLWASGCLRNFNSPNAGIRDVFDPYTPKNVELYGRDPDAPLPDPEDDQSGVEVAAINLELSQDFQSALNQNFKTLQEDNNFGIDVYLQVHEFIRRVTHEDPLVWKSTFF